MYETVEGNRCPNAEIIDPKPPLVAVSSETDSCFSQTVLSPPPPIQNYHSLTLSFSPFSIKTLSERYRVARHSVGFHGADLTFSAEHTRLHVGNITDMLTTCVHH